MPTKTLTDRFIAGAPDAGNYFDETITGLCLRVTKAGSKLWSFVYRVKGGGPQWLSLGSYPALPLVKAREAAKGLRRAVDEGRDPVAEKKAAEAAALIPPAPEAPVMTVSKFAPAFIKFQKGKKKSWRDDQQKVNAYLIPAWGDLPVAAITRKMVAELLTNIAGQGLTVGVNRIQSCISRLFAVAIDQGLYEDVNPTARMMKRFKEKARTRVLTEKEIRTLYAELEARPSEAADVFWLRLLLGQRAEETGGMRWSELDLEARTWFLDGVRTKNGVEHLLWLPDLALEVITRRRAAVPESAKYVFPAIADERQPKVQREISTAIAALFPNFTWKDLRRTMSTTLGDLGIDEGVIDRLLNHKAATVGRRHYNHAKYLPEKQVALAAWDRELTRILKNEPKTARVIPMPTR
jgi:integrase